MVKCLETDRTGRPAVSKRPSETIGVLMAAGEIGLQRSTWNFNSCQILTQVGHSLQRLPFMAVFHVHQISQAIIDGVKDVAVGIMG